MTLLRHAQIHEDFEGAYNGHNDIGLSSFGHAQAQALKTQLNMELFDAIYCSDLRRTKDTLNAFYKDASIIYTSKIREKSWGRHEGLNYDQIVAMEGQQYQDFTQWLNLLDGEPYEDFIERIKAFFFDFLPQQDYEEVLIVTHSGVIRILFHLIENISLTQALSRKVPYASLTKITLSKGLS